MTPKVRNCFEAAVGLGPEDTARFVAQFEQYKAAGASPEDAGRSAAADLLADIAAEAKEIGELIGGMVEDGAKAGTLTEAQARQRFNWQDMGTKDGTKTHALFFSDPADDRPMRYGEVSLFSGSTRFQVDGGESAATLKLAKAEAERVAIARLERDGYVGKTPQATAETVPAEPVSQEESEGPTPNYKDGDQIVPDKDVIEGDIVRHDGGTWMAKVKRGNSIPLLPIASGVPQVNADSLVRVDLTENKVTHTGLNFYGYGGQTKFGESMDVPPEPLRRLKRALDMLRDIERRLAGVQRARGDGHTLALEVLAVKDDIRKYSSDLDAFRSMAANNGVNVDAVIKREGGVPDLARFGKPASIVTPQVPVPAAAPAPTQGARVRFTPTDASPLGGGVVEGVVFTVDKTSGGAHRVRIRTDIDAPQGGGKVERLVYTNAGTFEELPEPIEKPAAAAVVQQAETLPQAKPEELTQDAPEESEAQETAESEKIANFGEKIGGSRADTAKPLGKRMTKEKDDRPAWARKYHAMPAAGTRISLAAMMSGQPQEAQPGDRWQLFAGEGSFVQPVSRTIYPSEQAALDAIPLVEVSRKHRVYAYKEGEKILWGIFRKMGDRKRTMVKGGFESEEAGMLALVADPVSIIEHKFAFPERPWLDNVERIGPARRTGNVTPTQFNETFGFRGGEFGKWNEGGDGQDVLNHAYDGLLDLADVLGLPPKAMSLNGELAIAFGARGKGGLKSGAAHYERDYEVMNLTKMQGAGSLAHEWFHALDHYLSRLDGKAFSTFTTNERGDRVRVVTKEADGNYLSHGALRKSNMRPELLEAFGKMIAALHGKPRQVPINVERIEKSVKSSAGSLDYRLNDLRGTIADGRYNRSKKTATPAQLAQWDALAERLRQGDLGEAKHIEAPSSSRYSMGRQSTTVIVEMNGIYKAVTGRSFDKTGYDSIGNAIKQEATNLKALRASLADATERAARGEMATITQGSDYATNAREIDSGRVSPYWSTPHEMGARAFEAYIMDRIAERAGRSDYLVYGAENSYYAMFGMKPYPEGDERKQINAAFDALFKTVEAKETDKGVALLSQAPAQPLTKIAASTTGTDPGKLTAMVENIRAGWADAPPVTVVSTVLDLPIRFLTELRRANAMNTARALIVPNTGQVYLIADRLENLADAQFVLFHEVLGHYGLRKFLGKDYEKTMRQMRAMNAGLAADSRSWMAEYGPGQIEARVKRGMSYAEATVEVDLLSVEEALSDRAGKPEPISGFKRLVAKLQAWLRDHGFMEVAKWLEGKTQAQVLSLLQSARDAVEKAEGVHAYTGGAVVAASQMDQTETPAFKRWFGASKVVDAEGKPLVVYHGTDVDFSAFDKDKIKSRFPYSIGYHFTTRPSEANIYASDKLGEMAREGGNVMPVYVRLLNPLIVDTKHPAASMEADLDSGPMFDKIRAARLAGNPHDGIIIRRERGDEWDGWNVIAFRPEQIKSAIGNSGDYDPSNPSILLSQHTPEQREALKRAGIAPKRRMKDNIRSAWEAAAGLIADRTDLAQGARQAMLDQFYGIQRAVQRDVGNLPLEQDPYVTARLANGGTSSVMRALLLHGQAQWAANGQHLEKKPGTVGLLDILKPLGDDLNDWFGWMIGNRAARLFKEGRENNFTEDQIKALQALGTPEKIAEFRKAAVQYAAFKRSVLDVAEAAGLINKETRPAWDNADYIPFYRQIDEKATFSATGKKGLAGQSSGIRTLKGGESALHDPIENLLMNFSRLIDASLKNNALSRTVRVLEDAKSTALSKTGYTMSAEIVPRSQIEKALADAGTPDYILAGLPPEAFEGMAKMWAIQPPTDPSVIRIMRGGKPQFYKVHDPLLLKAATSFVPFDFPGLGVMRAFKRVLTAMVTSTPEFMLRNFIRDSAAVQGIARTGVNPAKSLSGIVRAFKEDGAAEHMLFAGASFQSGNTNATDPTGTATSIRRALRQKGMDAAAIDGFMATIVDKPARLWELYKHVGEAIENANREAIFEATAKKGSVTAAAYEAKDLMDFSLRGSHPLYQLAADVLPFFNARVQGLYRVGRSNPGRLAVYAGIMAALSVALVMANSGEDWYDELPDWDKDAYWHFMIGGTHFRIPKPFELGVAFATIPERIARYLDGQDSGSKTVGRLFANVRDQLAFDPIPQAIRPAMNVWANKDTFRGAPIENIADEGKLPHARYSATTSPTARLVTDTLEPATDAIGLSPKKLEYLIGGYLGTVGTYALGAADMAVRELQDAPAQPAPRLDDLPIVKAFVREAPARSTVYENDLYEVRDRIEKIYRSAAAKAKEGNIKGAKADLDKYKPEMKARGTVLSAAATLAGIRREREKVYADRAMTPEAKRERLDELQVMENKAVKKAMTDPKVKALQ